MQSLLKWISRGHPESNKKNYFSYFASFIGEYIRITEQSNIQLNKKTKFSGMSDSVEWLNLRVFSLLNDHDWNAFYALTMYYYEKLKRSYPSENFSQK